MISIDNSQLEKVVQFGKFLEIISNPEALAKTIQELKAESARLKELVRIADTLDKADAYYETKVKEVQERANNVAIDRAALDKEKEQFQTYMKQMATDTSETSMKAQTLWSQAEEKEMKAQAMLQDAQQQKKEAAQQSAELNKREAELNAREQELNDKAVKLKELLGA